MVIYKKKKILVTGASGFIGSNLLKSLNRKNFLVSGISNSHSDNYSIKPLSLFSKKKITKYLHEHDFDFVIHLGASVEEYDSVDILKNNCQTTLNLLNACVDAKIKNFIYASSHTVYGLSHYLPIDENHTLNPTTHYSLSKLINENFCKLFSKHDINFTILRISSVYGNGQKQRFVIPTLINSCILQNKLVVHKYKNGFQIMDFVHVDDVCSSIELACNSKQKFGIYNIASGKSVTAFQIAKYLKDLSNTDSIKIKKIQKNTNHFIYDISKAKRELKFKPKIRISKKVLKPLLENFEKHLS